MIGVRKNIKRVMIVTAIALATLIAGVKTVQLQAQDSKAKVTLSKKQVKDLIANAKEPGDHLKLAAYFHQEAQRLEQSGKEHQKWGAIYAKGPAGSESKHPGMTNGAPHCEKWGASEIEAAKEAEAMAKMHEDMAKN